MSFTDFQDGLSSLQAELPSFLRKTDPSAQLYMALVAIATQIDGLSAELETFISDLVLAKASVGGMQRLWEMLYGVTNEQLPPTSSALRSYLQARAAENGSTPTLVNTLMTLIQATPNNTATGNVLLLAQAFPSNGTGLTLWQWNGNSATPASSVVANLVPDPSFEYDGLGGTPYSYSAGASNATVSTFQVQSGWAKSGFHSLRTVATINASGYVIVQSNSSILIPVTPNQTYSASVSLNVNAVSGPTTGSPISAWLTWFTATGGAISNVGGTSVTASGTATVSVVGATAPSNAAYARIGVICNNNSASALSYDFYLDAVVMTAGGSVPSYADGDLLGYQWSGSPGASTTVTEGYPKNLIQNPSFEYDALGAFPSAGWSANNTLDTLQVQSGWSAAGNKSLRATRTTAGAEFPGWAYQGAASSGFGVPVTAGAAYSFTVVVNILTNTCSGALVGGVRWFTSTGTQISDSNGTNLTAGTTGTHSFTFSNQIAPAGAAFGQVLVYAIAGGAGQVLDGYLDTCLFLQSTTLLAYFDGDSPQAYWDGTPGQSQSVLAVNSVQAPLPSAGLFFPASGGFTFPFYPASMPNDAIVPSDGTVSLGPGGSGLTFTVNGFLSIIPNYTAYQFTVQVKSELTFDRAAFSRAVNRFRLPHLLPPIIQEVP